ncbi:hypothetical protein fugu_012896 [Takifugu bimaculatus]|uniref:Coiled-coil domain-containing protein 177 n=1 Tax=Takifugu bimaculatus TaxID=433685 RepID=A0A4Z2C6R3_9TELE|nr:hypothetical protein fugu_012896 [Takifugu bimaculatus]
MGELNGTSSVLRWDLPPSEAEGSRPPRSVPTCARLGLRPVQLLIKSLNERLAERNVLPFESVRLMHESYEKERRRLLQTRQEETGRITEAAGDRLQCNDSQVSGPEVKDYKRDRRTTGPVQYADLCIKGGPASRSCSAADHPGRTRGCSFGLGDLKYPKAIEMKVERLTKDINEEMCVSLSERDRKIAALMLLKHQEEQDSLTHSQKQEQERQEAHRKEEAQRVEEDKERLKKLKKNMQRWQEELEARRRTRQQWEAETVGQREKEVQLQQDKWRRVKEEVEARRKENMNAAQKEACIRKHCQEEHLREKEEVEKRRQDRERRAAVEREQKAWRSKRAQVEKKRRQLEERNHQEILRHVLLREQAERRAEEEAAHRRRELERKLRRSCEKHAEATEERHKEAQQRAVQEEHNIERARERAEARRVGRLTYKQTLVRLSQQRTERAALLTFARTRDRAEQAKERNRRRQLCHGMLRERIRREEEEARQVRERCIRAKEWRRERLRRQREQLQEEARRLARASFHMRERVRQQTGRRSFHRMALEAQLSASLKSMKL